MTTSPPKLWPTAATGAGAHRFHHGQQVGHVHRQVHPAPAPARSPGRPPVTRRSRDGRRSPPAARGAGGPPAGSWRPGRATRGPGPRWARGASTRPAAVPSPPVESPRRRGGRRPGGPGRGVRGGTHGVGDANGGPVAPGRPGRWVGRAGPGGAGRRYSGAMVDAANAGRALSPGDAGAGGNGSFGPNAWLVDDMYDRFVLDPDSVSESWREFFSDYRPTPLPEARTAVPQPPPTDESAGPSGGTAPAAVPAWAAPSPRARRPRRPLGTPGRHRRPACVDGRHRCAACAGGRHRHRPGGCADRTHARRQRGGGRRQGQRHGAGHRRPWSGVGRRGG